MQARIFRPASWTVWTAVLTLTACAVSACADRPIPERSGADDPPLSGVNVTPTTSDSDALPPCPRGGRSPAPADPVDPGTVLVLEPAVVEVVPGFTACIKPTIRRVDNIVDNRSISERTLRFHDPYVAGVGGVCAAGELAIRGLSAGETTVDACLITEDARYIGATALVRVLPYSFRLTARPLEITIGEQVEPVFDVSFFDAEERSVNWDHSRAKIDVLSLELTLGNDDFATLVPTGGYLQVKGLAQGATSYVATYGPLLETRRTTSAPLLVIE